MRRPEESGGVPRARSRVARREVPRPPGWREADRDGRSSKASTPVRGSPAIAHARKWSRPVRTKTIAPRTPSRSRDGAMAVESMSAGSWNPSARDRWRARIRRTAPNPRSPPAASRSARAAMPRTPPRVTTPAPKARAGGGDTLHRREGHPSATAKRVAPLPRVSRGAGPSRGRKMASSPGCGAPSARFSRRIAARAKEVTWRPRRRLSLPRAGRSGSRGGSTRSSSRSSTSSS